MFRCGCYYVLLFLRPANIQSFAVLDLLGGNNRASSDFTQRFLKIADQHGFELPKFTHLEDLIYHSGHSSPHEVSSYCYYQYFVYHHFSHSTITENYVRLQKHLNPA